VTKEKDKLSEQYDKNFQILLKEAVKCSCWTAGGKYPKCSNKNHQITLKKERKLNTLCNQYEKIEKTTVKTKTTPKITIAGLARQAHNRLQMYTSVL